MAASGELKMFLEIWEERPHRSEVTGEPLVQPGHLLWINQFSHTLPKSIYGKIRLIKENIILMTPEQHTLYGTRPDLVRNRPEWQWVFEKYEDMRRRYHQKEWH
jgi:hypothetical protein